MIIHFFSYLPSHRFTSCYMGSVPVIDFQVFTRLTSATHPEEKQDSVIYHNVVVR